MSALAVEVASFGDGVLHLLPGAAVAGATWQLCKLPVFLAGSDAHAGQALHHISILDTGLLDYQDCACIHTTSYIIRPFSKVDCTAFDRCSFKHIPACHLRVLDTMSTSCSANQTCIVLYVVLDCIWHQSCSVRPCRQRADLMGRVLKSVIDGDWPVCASQVKGQAQKGCNSVVLCAGCHECQCFCHELPGYAT